MTEPVKICRRLKIEGRVQGVGYRAWFRDLARQFGLQGWVRNKKDGSVEALVNGRPDDINAIIKAAHAGPPLAEVETITEEPAIFDGPLSFEKMPDA